MRPHPIAHLAHLALVALATSCGDAFVEDLPPAVTPEQACAERATAACERIWACYPFWGKVFFGDQATCLAREVIPCLAELGAPGTSATVERALACADATRSSTCEEMEQGIVPSACRPAPGTTASGMPCLADAQCATARCAVTIGDVCGVCAALPQPGDPCGDNGPNCATSQTGLRCSFQGKCTVPAAEGHACGPEVPCQAALDCVRKTGQAIGKCEPFEDEIDRPCSTNGVEEPNCDLARELICHPATQRCDTLLYAPPGEACGGIGGDVVVCAPGFDCPDVPPQTTGVCPALAADGAPCHADEGPTCLWPARCEQGVCVLPAAGSCG